MQNRFRECDVYRLDQERKVRERLLKEQKKKESRKKEQITNLPHFWLVMLRGRKESLAGSGHVRLTPMNKPGKPGDLAVLLGGHKVDQVWIYNGRLQFWEVLVPRDDRYPREKCKELRSRISSYRKRNSTC